MISIVDLEQWQLALPELLRTIGKFLISSIALN
jgi:hypothetical protein